MAIETCATDMHRLDYRCYMMPTIESIDALPEDGIPMVFT